MRVMVRPGFISLRLLLFLAGIGLCWGGVQTTYTAIRYREPLSLTLDEYLRSQPAAKRLELREAFVDVLEAAHTYAARGDADAPARRIYIPLYTSPEAIEVEPVRVVLETADPELVRLYNEAREVPDEDAAEWYAANVERTTSYRTVSGMVRFGINMESRELEALRTGFGSDDFVIIEEGAAPGLGLGLVMTLLGLLLTGFMVLRFVDRAARQAASQPEAEPIAAGN